MKKLFVKSYDSYCKMIDQNMHLSGKKMKVRNTCECRNCNFLMLDCELQFVSK